MGRRGEDEFSRSSVAQVSQQDEIVGSSVEQVGKHIAGRSRSEGAKDPLIAAQSFNLHATLAGHLVQDVAQAGVIRANRQGIAGEINLGRACRLLQHGGCSLGLRDRGLRLRGRRWLCRDW